MYTVHVRGTDLPFFCVSAKVQLVQTNLQHSQAQPYGICTRVIFPTQTHLYVEKQLLSFFKVFDNTRP